MKQFFSNGLDEKFPIIGQENKKEDLPDIICDESQLDA